jgi:integrase/recombinase XerD
MAPMSRRRMIEDMTVRNLSRSTLQSHVYVVAKFSRHFNSPAPQRRCDLARPGPPFQ